MTPEFRAGERTDNDLEAAEIQLERTWSEGLRAEGQGASEDELDTIARQGGFDSWRQVDHLAGALGLWSEKV